MEIRKIEMDDLEQIPAVQTATMSRNDSFTSTMGEKLIIDMYKEYLKIDDVIFYGAFESKRLVGFLVGNPGDGLDNFLKKYRGRLFFKFLLNLMIFNRPAWRKLNATLFRRGEHWDFEAEEFKSTKCDYYGHLLQISLLPEFQGKGNAAQLMSVFENECINQAREKVQGKKKIGLDLSASNKNHRALSFYAKCGYKLAKQNKKASVFYKFIDD
ncbi:MAG TPA: GNAT family N-acetyltransferase [Bacilli bacterium]|nr:GNAT family N-acetyltransferase [Bacilli bacterium]